MRFYYFNSTHWDREWYQPLQRFRRYLVETTEGILTALEENAELKQFTFDGQTIVLEDVLEIMPALRERIARQVRQGRLNIGPWYVMPDEFLVSGESLIRNLLIGREVAESFGGTALEVGYICDIFGHTAQTPQIFHEFGLAPAVLWRGVNSRCAPFFLWEAPDGSRCETIRLMHQNGYADFSLWVTGWWDAPMSEEVFKARFKVEVERLKAHFGEDIILSDALDHIQIHAQAPQYFQWIAELYPEAEIIHTNYRDTLEIFRERDCPVVAGELVQPKDLRPSDGLLITHTLSSRCDVKAAHDRCQNRLELESDPIQAYAVGNRLKTMLPFWAYNWKQLIKNQAHDSICGCSLDVVHRHMLARFEEIDHLAEAMREDLVLQDRQRLTGRSILQDARTVMIEEPPAEADPHGCYLVRLYNPLPFEREETVELELRFPSAEPYPERGADGFGYEWIDNFRLYDREERELPYQLGTVKRNQMKNFYRHDSRFYDCYPVKFQIKLDACSWHSVRVRAVRDKVRSFASQLTSKRSASNGSLTLSVNADGTFDLTDLATGRCYRNLNDFSIDREIGDGWNHVQAAGATTFSQSLTACQVSVKDDGGVETVFEIIRSFEVPKELRYAGTIHESYQGIAESEEKASLVVVSRVRVGKGRRFVDVSTSIENTVKDCRVRVSMPTGIAGDYFAYQNYAFLNRSSGRMNGNDSETWQEPEAPEKNFSGIAGKRDASGGIALVARYGLHEVSSSLWDNGEMFFTLYRAFRRVVGTVGESECQLLKKLEFEYRFVLLDETVTQAELYRQMLQYRSTPIHHQLAESAVTSLPAEESWISLEGGLSFGALKPAQDQQAGTVILRLVNLSDTAAAGRIALAVPATLQELYLNETPKGESRAAAREFEVEAGPWKILTFKLQFTGRGE